MEGDAGDIDEDNENGEDNDFDLDVTEHSPELADTLINAMDLEDAESNDEQLTSGVERITEENHINDRTGNSLRNVAYIT